jgi:PRD1 phage membrane DNA delivery
MNDVGQKIGAFIAAIIGLAVLAIVISARANTVNVLGAFFGGVTNLVGVAISPVTGTSAAGAGLGGGSWEGTGGSPYASGFALPATGGGGGGAFGLSTPGGFNLGVSGVGDILGGLGSLVGGGGGGGGSLFSGLGSMFGGGGGGFIDSGSF